MKINEVNILRADISLLLRNRMKELNLTLYDLEISSSLEGRQIKSVLSGYTNYTIDSLIRVCYALKYKISFLNIRNNNIDAEKIIEKVLKKEKKDNDINNRIEMLIKSTLSE